MRYIKYLQFVKEHNRKLVWFDIMQIFAQLKNRINDNDIRKNTILKAVKSIQIKRVFFIF